MKRLLGCLLLLCLMTGLSFCQDLNARVTYKTVAVPARRAIADLAAATHLDLGVTDPLDSQPLILRLQDVSIKEAMDKIAAVLHGTWVQNKNSFTLQRTDEMQETLRQTKLQENLAELQKAWKSYAETAPQIPLTPEYAEATLREQKANQTTGVELEQDQDAPPKEPTEAELQAEEAKAEAEAAKAERDRTLSAAGRLQYRVILAIDPALLVTAPTNNAMVFSTQPRPLQYQLQLSAEDIQALVDEQNIWTTADQKVNPDNYPKDAPFFFAQRHMIQPGDAQVIAMVNRDGNGMPISIQVSVVDSKGRKLVEPDYFGDLPEQLAVRPEPTTSDFSKWNLPFVKISPLSAEIILLSRSDRSASESAPQISGALRQFLIDPSNRDPLSLYMSEVLIGCADKKNLNLVASPTDATFDGSEFSRTDGIPVADLLTFAADNCGCAVRLENSWLTISSKDTLKSEAVRTNRESLSTAVKAIYERGFASLDALGDFAAANSNSNDFTLLNAYVLLGYPNMRLLEDLNLPALRLYGLLSSDQRDALRHGARLNTEEMSEAQQAAFLDALQESSYMVGADANGFYDQNAHALISDGFDPGRPIWSSFTQPQPVEESPPIRSDDDVDFMDSPLSWNYTQYVNQLPSQNLYLNLAFAEGDQICELDLPNPQLSTEDSHNGPSTHRMWVSPGSVAAQMNQKNGDIVTFASCPTRCIQLQLGVAHRFTMFEELIEHGAGMTAFGPVEKLPENIRKAIAKSANEGSRYQSPLPDFPGGQPQTPPTEAPPPPPH